MSKHNKNYPLPHFVTEIQEAKANKKISRSNIIPTG